MQEVIIYSLVSVFLVSLVSFVGLFTFSIKPERLQTILIYLISFSAGALFGDAFIHLLPEAAKISGGLSVGLSLSILVGILIFFILEKSVHIHQCHMPITKHHVHAFTYMNLMGDGLHNFIDGMIIAASYVISIPLGIATTTAVFLHEIPKEIGGFGVLIHGGFTRVKALWVNFLTGLVAIIGAVIGLFATANIPQIRLFLLPLAIGGFIYIAGSDLIPELHKQTRIGVSILQIISFIAGIIIMLAMLLLE